MTKKIFNRKKVMTFLCLVILSLGNIAQAVPKSDFVLMVYMNGSNLESDYKLATSNIQDMLWEQTQETTNNNLTILLLMGGTQTWHLNEKIPGQTLPSDSIIYATITREGFKKVRSLRNQSIGNSSTLTEFINYGTSRYPAEKCGLIFWNHGAGSVTGFGYDELYPDDTSLSLAEIRQGLQDSYFSPNSKFTFIGFDACLMATLETASTVSPYADFLVASQELEPGKGWDYKSIIHFLRNDYRHQEDWSIGRLISDSFVDSYREKEYEQVTLSVTDLNKVAALTSNIGRLSAEIEKKLVHETDTLEYPFYKRLSRVRAESKSFGMPALTYHGPDMVDLMDFCLNMGKEADQSLINTISRDLAEAVIYTRKSDNLRSDRICGLSVYFPNSNLSIAKDLSEYQRCGFNKEYLSLVNTYAQRLLEGNKSKKIKDIVQNNSLRLSTEMLLNVRKIYSVVLASDDNQWITYGLDGDGVSLDQDGRIIKKDYNGNNVIDWDKKWISVGGKTVSAYISQSNAKSLTYTIPVYLNNELADLILKYDNINPSGKVYGARRITNNNIPDKGITEIKANDSIILLHERFDENGSTNYVPGDTIIVKKKKDIKVDTTLVPTGKYRYGYCLIDLYGRKYYTKFTDYEVN